MTLLAKVNRLPPFVCRILARKHNGRARMTIRDIAQAAGLPKSTVADLSVRVSWAGVPVDVADCFARGCGVDLMRQEKQVEFLKRGRKSYLSQGTLRERRMYVKLFALIGQVTAPH